MRHLRPTALPLACLLLSVVFINAAGCDYEEYTIELTPQGELMGRVLTAQVHSYDSDISFPAVRAALIGEAYSERLETDSAQTAAFRGQFGPQMPDDIGGKGEYVVYRTIFGNAYAYSEQFRGSDEPGRFIDEYFAWVDEVVDILTGWLETELGETSGWPQFKRLLDKEVRADLKDLGVYYYLAANRPQMLWEAEAVDEEPFMEQLGFRVLQYLVAHNYLTAEQVPQVTRLLTSVEEDEAALAELVVGIARRKAGIEDEGLLTALRNLLSDTEALKVSLGEYITVSMPIRDPLTLEVDARPAETSDDPTTPHDPEENSTPLLPAPPVDIDIFGSDDRLSLTLNLPEGSALVNSNGLVSGDSDSVTWSSHLPDKNTADRLPVHCYATWTVANGDTQTQHLGAVGLTGEGLLKYAIWRNGLSAAEAAEWDAVVAALSPDDEASVDALRNFQFAGEPTEDADGNRFRTDASGGIALLLPAMD